MWNKSWQNLSARSAFTLWNILGFIVFGSVLAAVIVSLWFIYQNVYITLDSANSIVVLRSAPDLDVINETLFAKTEAIIQYKTATTTVIFPTRNVFLPALATTTPAGQSSLWAAPASSSTP